MTSMAKFEVSGAGYGRWLDTMLANRCPRRIGQIVPAHLLTKSGGVRSEFTVTRLADNMYYLVATPRGEWHDFDVLQKLLLKQGDVGLRNVTYEWGCFTIPGPMPGMCCNQLPKRVC